MATATKKDFDAIINDPRLSRNFRRRFNRYIRSIGEDLVVPSSTKRILIIMQMTGKWAGQQYRVHMNDDGSFFKTERKFGG